MDTNTRAAGFYGTDSEVYYVSVSGRAWIVASEDDLGTQDPVEIDVANMPALATDCDDLLTMDEVFEHLRRIEAVSSEKLVDSD